MTVPPPPYANSRRDAKAQAKAAKAYAKAQRPFYKKKRFILPMGVAALAVIFSVSTAGGGGGDVAAADTSSAKSVDAKADAGTKPTRAMPLQDGDWRLDSITVKDDGLGSFGGRARITYTGDDKSGGDNVFTITVFKAGKDIATLDGGATDVKPGRTVTVDLISADDFVGGNYTYSFQNNL